MADDDITTDGPDTPPETAGEGGNGHYGIEDLGSLDADPGAADNAEWPTPEPVDDVDIAELRAKHRPLIEDLDHLAQIKRQANAGAIEPAVYEAELLHLVQRQKKQGMKQTIAREAVAKRLHSAMSSEEAEERLAEAGAQRDEILQLGLAGEIWHDPDLEAYATIERAGGYQTLKVRSRDYRLYLNSEYHKRHGRVPTATALSEGIEAIEAEARNGNEHEAFVRVAGAGGKVYLDLANEAWTVVEIDAAGWRVIDRPPVRFIRPRGLRALPDPQPGNGLDGSAKLQALVNLHGDDFRLYVSWIVACLMPAGPYPILVLSGEHGAAKSSTVKIGRDLIDPGKVKLSGPPHSEPDLAIAASKRHVLAYDNLSAIPEWLADALCRLATGGGLQKRMLFTDDEQNLLAVCCPIALAGIPDLTSRADLADRAIVAVLRSIPEDARLTEEELSALFEQSAPEILGAVLNGAALALRDRARQAKAMTQKPRMADFAVWATACETALWPTGTFARAYAANREAAIESIIDADPIAAFVRELMSSRSFWTGSAADLLRISLERTGQISNGAAWLKNPGALAGHLRRAQTFLRALGIDIAFNREGRAGNRIIRIRTSLENTVSTVSNVSSVRGDGPDPRPAVQAPRTAAGDADGTDAQSIFP